MICTILNAASNHFSLSGKCPHCLRSTVFMVVAGPYVETDRSGHGLNKLCAAMQCQGCQKYILGIVQKPQNSTTWLYLEHYPVCRPSQDVPAAIPENIANDFKEALRCRFVEAYNATVEMCRRAVQASCIHLHAPSDQKLVRQIDWLAEQGTITTPLKDMAHRIRLGGNLGAHPPENPDDETEIVIGPEYADAVIEFTRDLFQHVYVMPEQLKKFTFKKVSPAQA